jgi:type IV secretory pathway TrbD component
MAMANDGSGSMIEFEGIPQALNKNHLLIGAEAEVLANGTIKLGFNLQRWFARSQQKLIADIRAFKTELWEAFYRDYQKVKKQRGCQ